MLCDPGLPCWLWVYEQIILPLHSTQSAEKTLGFLCRLFKHSLILCFTLFCVFMGVQRPQNACRSQRTTFCSDFLLLRVDPRDPTQVVRPSGKCRYMRSISPAPLLVFIVHILGKNSSLTLLCIIWLNSLPFSSWSPLIHLFLSPKCWD